MSESRPGGEANSIVLWDLPVRLVHWAWVILLPGLYFSWKTGNMDIHVVLGEVMLALLLFRLLWGFFGSENARFASFIKGPQAVLTYLRGGSKGPSTGHNPLGALSVVAMIALMVLQVALGLFASDTDGLFSGPLDRFVSYDTSLAAAELHESVFNLILIMVALHLAAIIFYRVIRKDDLVRPMITGRKTIQGATQPALAAPARMIICAVVAAALAYWIAQGMHPM